MAGLLAPLLLLGCASRMYSGRWVSVSSPHFEVFGQADVSDMRSLAEDLEGFRQVALKLTNVPEQSARERVWVYALSGEGFASLRPRSDLTGYLVRTHERNLLVLDLSNLQEALRSARHEYVHVLLRSTSRFPYPIWYHEGLAEFLSTARIGADQVTLGSIPPPQAELLTLTDQFGQETSVTPSVGFDEGSSISNALVAATRELVRAPSAEATQRRVVVLSDGFANFPDPTTAQREALRTAERLARYGVRVDVYAVGPFARRKGRTFGEVARRTDGRFVAVDRPGDIEEVLSEVRLAGLESVTIRNLTSGRDGRAVRVFADGSYDGFVPVEPGPNQLEVRARMSDASTASGTVDIFVERAEVQSEQERADDQRLLDELRARTAETELLEEQERARKQRGETSVEIEVEKDEEKPESEPKPETDPAPRP